MNKKGVIAVISILVLIIVVLLIYIVAGKNSDKATDNKEVTTASETTAEDKDKDADASGRS